MQEDLDLRSSISGNIAGKMPYAFGDATATPVLTTVIAQLLLASFDLTRLMIFALILSYWR